jgi:hypothetical protein
VKGARVQSCDLMLFNRKLLSVFFRQCPFVSYHSKVVTARFALAKATVKNDTNGNERTQTETAQLLPKRAAQTLHDVLHVVREDDHEVAFAYHRRRAIHRLHLVEDDLDAILAQTTLQQSCTQYGRGLSR